MMNFSIKSRTGFLFGNKTHIVHDQFYRKPVNELNLTSGFVQNELISWDLVDEIQLLIQETIASVFSKKKLVFFLKCFHDEHHEPGIFFKKDKGNWSLQITVVFLKNSINQFSQKKFYVDHNPNAVFEWKFIYTAKSLKEALLLFYLNFLNQMNRNLDFNSDNSFKKLSKVFSHKTIYMYHA